MGCQFQRGGGIPVERAALHPVAALEQQDPPSCVDQPLCRHRAAEAASNDDRVVHEVNLTDKSIIRRGVHAPAAFMAVDAHPSGARP